MDYGPEVAKTLKDAFTALQGNHPEVMAKIAAAVDGARGKPTEVAQVEIAIREAAIALQPKDREAAQTLFSVAESLAEIASYWDLQKD